MDLHLELPISEKEKFMISNEKTKHMDDDLADLIFMSGNKKIFSFRDSFAFEIGDIMYRWLNGQDADIHYGGKDFVLDFIRSEEEWEEKTPLSEKIKEKSPYSKYWLFSSGDADVFTFSRNGKRYLLIIKDLFGKNGGKIIYQAEIAQNILLSWRSVFQREYLPRLERERKMIRDANDGR